MSSRAQAQLHAGFLALAAMHLRSTLRYVARVESLLMMGVMALLLGLLDGAAALPNAPVTVLALLSRFSWAGYFYLVLRKAADGARQLPALADYRATWDTLIHPLTLGAAASAWYVALLALLIRHTVGLEQFTQQFQLRALDFFRQPNPLSHAVLLVTLIQLPAALVASVTHRARVVRLLDPTFGLRVVSGAADDYLSTYAALQALIVASFLVGTIAGLLDQALPIPVAGPVLRHMLQLWVPLAQARLLGDFAWRNSVSLTASAGTHRQRPGAK